MRGNLGQDVGTASYEGQTSTAADATATAASEFNAPTWLEEPCAILWNAMQARINGALPQAVSYLNAFWSDLDVVKQSATDATWPEILAIDSQSQIQSANITSAIIGQVEQDANSFATFATLFGWQGADVKATIANLQAQRAAALQSAADLAAQANTAQSARVTALASGLITQDQVDVARENTDIANILKSPFTMLGIPWWAWLLGAGGLLWGMRGRS